MEVILILYIGPGPLLFQGYSQFVVFLLHMSSGCHCWDVCDLISQQGQFFQLVLIALPVFPLLIHLHLR
jgi:hypothetical protein